MIIGQKEFTVEAGPYVMGILNVTPDSFSDGGEAVTQDQALKKAKRLIEEGADIIDIGGESTRPGYTKISDEEELERVCPIIEKIAQNFDITISLDTYKSKVARAGLKAGAHLINDIWGLKYDAEMKNVIAASKAAVCIMHNRTEAVYKDFVTDVLKDIEEAIAKGVEAGIAKEKIMIDPGIGFAKTTEENLIMLRHLAELKKLGYPILLGTSRKSVIGNTLQLSVNERLEGTLATTAWGYNCDTLFFRVHDVKENVRLLRMLKAIREAK